VEIVALAPIWQSGSNGSQTLDELVETAHATTNAGTPFKVQVTIVLQL
jgi:hypothetical protein